MKVVPEWLVSDGIWASDADVSVVGVEVEVVRERVRTWKLWRWTR